MSKNKINFEELLDGFFREWNALVESGKASPLTRLEIFTLEDFVRYCQDIKK